MPAPIETWAEAAVTVPAARRSRAKSALRVVFISHLVGFISARCWSSSKCSFRARSLTYKARAVPDGFPRENARRDPQGGRLGGGKGTIDTAPFAARRQCHRIPPTPLCPLGPPALRSLTLGPSPLRGAGGPRDQPRGIAAGRCSSVPPLQEGEGGPGGEASEGRPTQRAERCGFSKKSP